MTVVHCGESHQDPRGHIIDIVQDVQVEHATIITSRAGTVRGNHYHKESTQYVFVISGRLQAYARREGEGRTSAVLIPGDLVINEPLERHALHALEDSTFLVLTRGPRGGTKYETDTYREDV